MDLIHKFLNIALPPVTFFTLMLLYPPFLFFKFGLSVLRSIFFTEDVSGKVVLITGASSGIGENLAYEYARRGANLALAARRENRLREVADRARELGSPDAVAIRADVSEVEDCRRMVEQTVNHFGKLDHLVNNAGITSVCLFEEVEDATEFRPVMDTNFWGTVYTTRFAIPHLRNSNGKLIDMSSSASWLPAPRTSLYNASKAAMAQFFETLRVELGSDVHVTLVTPGFVESELTQGKFLMKGGKFDFDPEIRDVQVGIVPVGKAEACAKAIVKGACRGERYVTEPAWFRVTHLWKLLCPEILEWTCRVLYITESGVTSREALSKKVLDVIGAQKMIYPETVQTNETKVD